MTTTEARKGSTLFIALIAATMSMSALSIDINLPAIPVTALDFGTSETRAQLTVTLFFLGFALGQILYGSLSDRYGRKPVLMFGIAAYILTNVGCALAGSIEQLLVMRFIQGIAAASGPIIGRAIVRDRFEGAEMARTMSFAMAAFITAPIIAPSISALLMELGSWRWIFVFLGVFGLLLLLLVAVKLEESLQHRDASAMQIGQIISAYPRFWGHAESRTYGIVTVSLLGMLLCYLVNAAPIFITGFGFSTREFGITFGIIAMFSAVGSLVNSRLVRLMPLARILTIALVGALVMLCWGILVTLTHFGGIPALVISFCGFFFCFTIIMPNATALAMEPHRHSVGAATSALGFTQSIIPAIIGSIVAVLNDGTPLPTLLGMTLLGFIALAAIGQNARRRQRSPATASD